ncbi:MAG: hypothetical protein AB7E47_01455 [Desulfovibrionaceae bacterium]
MTAKKPQKLKKPPKTQEDIYVQRFAELGIELPEIVTASTPTMAHVAQFLITHRVFDIDEEELKRRLEG